MITTRELLTNCNDPTLKAWSEEIHLAIKDWEWKVWFNGAFPWLDDARTDPWDHSPDDIQMRGYKSNQHAIPGSLQALVWPSNERSWSATVGSRRYLVFSMAGRVLFQVQEGENFVCVCCDQSSPAPRSGLYGIYATLEQAKDFLSTASKDWAQGQINLQPDSQVRSPV